MRDWGGPKESARVESNHQPPGLQPGALPIEPLPVPGRAGCPKADRVVEVAIASEPGVGPKASPLATGRIKFTHCKYLFHFFT